MATVTLSDGRSLELRPMYISEKLRIIKTQESEDERYIDILTGMAEIIEPAVLSKSWEGSLLDMSEQQLLSVARAWSTISEDDALPPENGTDSETK